MMLSKLIILTLLIFTINLSSQDIDYSNSESKIGNIDFKINNLGQLGYSRDITQSGFIWPRGSKSQYIYGSGLAVFAKLPNGENRNFYTYLPNTSNSDYLAGSYADNDEPTDSKYRIYNSNHYDRNSGIAINDSLSDFRWPIWTGNTLPSKTYGNYIIDANKRSRQFASPNFRADEELVSIVKIDNSYPIEKIPNPKEFEDMRLDIETRTYSYEEIPDVLFVSWVVHNRGSLTLDDIAFAPVFDVDINDANNRFKGVDNDIMILPKDSSYALFATEIGDNEEGIEFGYIAFDWFTGSAMETEESIKYLDFYSYYDFNLSTDYSTFDYIDYVKSGVEKKSTGEQSMFAPTHSIDLPPGAKVRLTMQIMLFEGDDNYPNIAESKLNNLDSELDANWSMFRDNVLTNIENETNSSIKLIYPNPATNYINIDPAYINKIAEIISISGQVVLSSVGKNRIDVSSLSAGTYILKIDGISQKFVVEK